jgi:hypothetical protein
MISRKHISAAQRLEQHQTAHHSSKAQLLVLIACVAGVRTNRNGIMDENHQISKFLNDNVAIENHELPQPRIKRVKLCLTCNLDTHQIVIYLSDKVQNPLEKDIREICMLVSDFG